MFYNYTYVRFFCKSETESGHLLHALFSGVSHVGCGTAVDVGSGQKPRVEVQLPRLHVLVCSLYASYDPIHNHVHRLLDVAQGHDLWWGGVKVHRRGETSESLLMQMLCLHINSD